MKKLIVGAVAVALLGAAAFAMGGPNLLGDGIGKGKTEAAPLPAQKAESKIVSEAHVVPLRSASLGLSGGTIAEVLVAEGDRVQAGQVLVRLDAARQRVAVAQAEAGLLRAQAHLDEVKAGPRAEEIEGATAAVEMAQARLADLQAGPRAEEVASSRAGVAAAQAQLSKVNQGARGEEIAAAEAALASAQASLEKTMQGADEAQIIAARADLENAVSVLTQAQAVYDQVFWRTDIQARPEAVQLQQATNNHAAAKARLDNLLKQPDSAAVASARSQVEQAQAKLNMLKAAARPADLAAAQAEINRAQAQLQLAQSGARPEAIAGAEAEVRRAQAQLKLLQAGTRPEIVAGTEADLASARASLAQAKVALAETELRAPFAGAIASLDVKVGEQIAANSPIVRLADLSAWQIETSDLTELSIVHVREGSPVVITFDAIPGLELPGKVTRIKALGENKRGDINYTVTVKPDQIDERLRWNMTASVNIARN